ncbi:APH(3') family aminoglycoside O-phosphotransferase [Kitasatospora sp. NPDC002227]|uniref:APH(3') family aminoglycoside O-phosphotransferase n=1 Tax=Kitasatospora sp. NPDC002227 TaxID=3154773 RepID=UPI0033272648
MVEQLKRRYDRHEWEPVTMGMSGAGVWRLTGPVSYFLKAGAGVAQEAARAAWLAGQGLPVAEVVDHGADEHGEWVLTTALGGRSAGEPWPARQRDGVTEALASVARALHTLPVAQCPFDRRLAVTLPLARAAVADGAAQSPSLLGRLEATRPAEEDLAVCHGDFCVPNVLLDPDTLAVTGLVDLGRLGVADRCADLGLMTRSLADRRLNPQYGGPAAAERFLAAYGGEVAEERLAYYRLLDEFA